MQALEIAIYISALAIPVLGAILWYRSRASALEKKTIPHIRSMRVTLADGSVLSGATAQVAKRTRSYYPHDGEAENFTLTEILRTPEGTHVMVKATPGKGVHYCKVLQGRTVARLLRKGAGHGVSSDA